MYKVLDYFKLPFYLVILVVMLFIKKGACSYKSKTTVTFLKYTMKKGGQTRKIIYDIVERNFPEVGLKGLKILRF